MTVIDQTKYPHGFTLRFRTQEEGRKCFPRLTQVFKSYEDGQSHPEYDFLNIEFYLPTLHEKEKFEAQANDILKKLIADNSFPI